MIAQYLVLARYYVLPGHYHVVSTEPASAETVTVVIETAGTVLIEAATARTAMVEAATAMTAMVEAATARTAMVEAATARTAMVEAATARTAMVEAATAEDHSPFATRVPSLDDAVAKAVEVHCHSVRVGLHSPRVDPYTLITC